jgi:outer membrane receptor protein involved in Fe transport
MLLRFVLLAGLAAAPQGAQSPRPAELRGSLRAPDGGPAVGELTLASAGRVTVATGSADEQGEFRLERLAPGSYLLRVTSPGFAVQELALDLAPGESRELRVVLALNPVYAEVSVSADANQVELAGSTVQRVNILPRNVLEERAVTALSEAAEGESGLAQLRTSPAMGAFQVRGLTGKNVAVYRDGIRYTTAAQRGGVSTFFNLLDAGQLESLEVVRGPNSAQYGSDALGGVVSLQSPGAGLSGGGLRWRGESAAQYSSAAHSFGATLRGAASAERWGATGTLAARRVNRLRPGGGRDSHAALERFLGLPSSLLGERLPDTGFTQYGGSLRAQVMLGRDLQWTGHYERGQQDGARRYDQLLGGDGNLIADVRNVMSDFGYARLQRFHAGWLDQFSLSASYNAQREQRVNQGGQGNPLGAITDQYERLAAWGLQWQGERRAGRHSLLAGGDGYLERIAAPAFTTSLTAGRVTPSRPRVPHGARYRHYGLFVQNVYRPWGERLRVAGALRFGGAGYRSRAAHSPLVGGQPLWPGDSLAASALSGRLGAALRLTETLGLHGGYSRGFRAPNMTDLGTLGLQGNGSFEASPSSIAGRGATLGDRADDRAQSTGAAVAALRPETSDNLDAGFHLRTAQLELEATVFRMRLGNSIVSQTLLLPPGAVGQPLGDQVIARQLPSGVVFVPISNSPVLVRGNYGGARQTGFEQSSRLRLGGGWSLRQNLTWIRAADALTGLAPDIEPGTPAPAAHLTLLYSPRRSRLWLEFYAAGAWRQSRLSSLALADRRTGAPRSRSSIASFFNNGARARGLVDGGRLLATGETLEQVQQRVLGAAASAPLFSAIPGYALFGLRAGMPLGLRASLAVDLSNLADRSYRGIGWGVDGPGRAITLRYRREL